MVDNLVNIVAWYRLNHSIKQNIVIVIPTYHMKSDWNRFAYFIINNKILGLPTINITLKPFPSKKLMIFKYQNP